MLAGGVKEPEVLDELEMHLREDIAARVSGGAAAQDAFDEAVRRMGQPAALRSEFSKVSATWAMRAQKVKQAVLKFLGVRAPVPALGIWTAGAQSVLALGRQEAHGFHHDFVGTEHLLLGLLGSEAVGVNTVLRKLGVDRQVIRSEIEKIVGTGPVQTPGRVPYTPRAKKALMLATREARAQKRGVGTEHIFLGLLREGSGVAALVLKNLGVNPQNARDEMLRNQTDSGPSHGAK